MKKRNFIDKLSERAVRRTKWMCLAAVLMTGINMFGESHWQ
jgi:hypothetical protein